MAKQEAVRVYGCCAHGFGLSWALFTLCFLIINIVVFASPQWIGDTLASPGVGYFGIYQLCEFVNFGADRICDGWFVDFDTILTTAFKASTIFVGVSVLVIILCVLLFLLFLCVEPFYVFVICGILQVISCEFYNHFTRRLFLRSGAQLQHPPADPAMRGREGSGP